MRTSFFFIVGVLLLVLQTTFLPLLPDWFGKPDLLFMLVVFLSLRFEFYKGFILVFLFGIFMDVFSGIYQGVYPIIYLLLFFILRGLSKSLDINETTHQPPLLTAGYLLSSGGIFLFANMLAEEGQLQWSWLEILQEMIILAILAMPFSLFFSRCLDLIDKNKAKRMLMRTKTGNRYI